MRTVAFIPSRLNSQRVPNKNIKVLGDKPLINYILDTLNMVTEIDENIIFTSDFSIERYIDNKLHYRLLKRPEFLDTQEAKVQDLIREFLKLDNAQIIVMAHITSPFLQPTTVSECIRKVKSGNFDSAFTALEIKNNCWFNSKPLNNIAGSSKKAVLAEQGLYVFKRSVFEQNERRISNPFIKPIGNIEGHDIDTIEDFKIAEILLDNTTFKQRVI